MDGGTVEGTERQKDFLAPAIDLGFCKGLVFSRLVERRCTTVTFLWHENSSETESVSLNSLILTTSFCICEDEHPQKKEEKQQRPHHRQCPSRWEEWPQGQNQLVVQWRCKLGRHQHEQGKLLEEKMVEAMIELPPWAVSAEQAHQPLMGSSLGLALCPAGSGVQNAQRHCTQGNMAADLCSNFHYDRNWLEDRHGNHASPCADDLKATDTKILDVMTWSKYISKYGVLAMKNMPTEVTVSATQNTKKLANPNKTDPSSATNEGDRHSQNTRKSQQKAPIHH